MVPTIVRRIGVVGAMTLAGAGVAAGSAFAANDDPTGLQGLPTDLPLGSTSTGFGHPGGPRSIGGLGSTVGNVPVVGPIAGEILGSIPIPHQPPHQFPHHSPQSRSWHPESWQQHSRHHQHSQDCGCHHAPPPHHCPPAPHHHHHKHHQQHHHHHNQHHHHHSHR